MRSFDTVRIPFVPVTVESTNVKMNRIDGLKRFRALVSRVPATAHLIFLSGHEDKSHESNLGVPAPVTGPSVGLSASETYGKRSSVYCEM